jgi:hypothetical protein
LSDLFEHAIPKSIDESDERGVRRKNSQYRFDRHVIVKQRSPVTAFDPRPTAILPTARRAKMTMKCLAALMLFDSLGIAIGHQIQPDAMFEQGLAPAAPAKTLRRVGDLLYQFVPAADVAGLGNADERRVPSCGVNVHSTVLLPCCPGHSIDAFVPVDRFHGHVPPDIYLESIELAAGFESAALREPELRRQRQVDERFEYVLRRLSESTCRSSSGFCFQQRFQPAQNRRPRLAARGKTTLFGGKPSCTMSSRSRRRSADRDVTRDAGSFAYSPNTGRNV